MTYDERQMTDNARGISISSPQVRQQTFSRFYTCTYTDDNGKKIVPMYRKVNHYITFQVILSKSLLPFITDLLSHKTLWVAIKIDL